MWNALQIKNKHQCSAETRINNFNSCDKQMNLKYVIF